MREKRKNQIIGGDEAGWSEEDGLEREAAAPAIQKPVGVPSSCPHLRYEGREQELHPLVGLGHGRLPRPATRLLHAGGAGSHQPAPQGVLAGGPVLEDHVGQLPIAADEELLLGEHFPGLREFRRPLEDPVERPPQLHTSGVLDYAAREEEIFTVSQVSGARYASGLGFRIKCQTLEGIRGHGSEKAC